MSTVLPAVPAATSRFVPSVSVIVLIGPDGYPAPKSAFRIFMENALALSLHGLPASWVPAGVRAGLALANGWAGLVLNACVRDTVALAELPIGLLAIGACPRPRAKTGEGEVDVPVRFGGVEFAPGATLHADDDGVIVLPGAQAVELANRAMDVLEKENRLRAEIDAGKTLSEVAYLQKWEKAR